MPDLKMRFITTGGFVSMFVFQVALAADLQMLNVLPQYANLVTPDTLHLSPLLIGRCYYQSERPR